MQGSMKLQKLHAWISKSYVYSLSSTSKALNVSILLICCILTVTPDKAASIQIKSYLQSYLTQWWQSEKILVVAALDLL